MSNPTPNPCHDERFVASAQGDNYRLQLTDKWLYYDTGASMGNADSTRIEESPQMKIPLDRITCCAIEDREEDSYLTIGCAWVALALTLFASYPWVKLLLLAGSNACMWAWWKSRHSIAAVTCVDEEHNLSIPVSAGDKEEMQIVFDALNKMTTNTSPQTAT